MKNIKMTSSQSRMDVYDSLPIEGREFCGVSGYCPVAFANDLVYNNLKDALTRADKSMRLTKHTVVTKLYGSKHPDLPKIVLGALYERI
jgi:hypothetical protein